MIVGLFLGAGTHEPTGTLFRWFASNVPYFSLFRSPWYIFTPLLTLSLAALTALYLDKIKTNLASYLAVFLIVTNLVYCYPLVTGRIFRPSKSDAFFVNFPKHLFDVGNKLPEISKNRTISYPDDQLEKFNWGYIGVEPVINLFSDKEMVYRGINNTSSPFALIVDQLYEKIKLNNFTAAKNIAAKLNSDSILEKSDQITLATKIQSEVSTYKTNGSEWSVYKLNEDNKDKKIVLANNFYFIAIFN